MTAGNCRTLNTFQRLHSCHHNALLDEKYSEEGRYEATFASMWAETPSSSSSYREMDCRRRALERGEAGVQFYEPTADTTHARNLSYDLQATRRQNARWLRLLQISIGTPTLWC